VSARRASGPPTELILTASGRGQAIALRRSLQRDPRLAEAVGEQVLVVPDAGGRRVGSGQATLAAVAALARRRLPVLRRGGAATAEAVRGALRGRRITVIHSGGDSRRLPALAAEGKILAPLPDRGSPRRDPARPIPTLLERIVLDLESIAIPPEGGVLVASGDVFLDLAAHDLAFEGDHATSVAFPADPPRGSRHGVLVVASDGRVREFLQKPTPEASRLRGAMDETGRVLVDTGVVFVPIATIADWIATAAASGLLGVEPPSLDLYGDLLPALAAIAPPVPADPRAATFLGAIRRDVEHAGGLRASIIPTCAFRHPGSTREWLAEVGSGPEPGLVRDAAVPPGSRIGRGAILDRCAGEGTIELGEQAILVGVPAGTMLPVTIPPRRGIVVLPILGGGHAAIAFAVEDDFKTPREQGGTIVARSLDELDESAWAGDASRPGVARSLWNARVWRIGPAEESIRHAIAVVAEPRTGSRRGRVSAGEILGKVDHRRLVAERLEARRRAIEVARGVEVSPLRRARLARLDADLVAGGASEEDRREAFAAIAEAVRSKAGVGAIAARDPSANRPRRVRVMAPARIDLAGGWTDTPPICLERGGRVVNVAVEVDGVAPLEAVVTRIDRPIVRITSEDLARSIEIRSMAELLRAGDPRDAEDWALLPRTAVSLAGVPEAPSRDLASVLQEEGGGLELRIASRLPKGSGLGTSSILGAAAIAALARSRGIELDRDELVRRTSELEQRMGTAGGWQDQAGGITAGAKHLATEPGLVQAPREEPLAIDERFWRERVLVHSTGMQRLARNILQGVVWRWLGGGLRIGRIVAQLHANAERLRNGLLEGRPEAIAEELAEYWRLKREIDPGATTPAIEAMVEPIVADLSAWSLPGAGGGGFLLLVAKDADASRRIRESFTRRPPHPGGRFHEVTVASRGLRVEIES